jgi:hypothetical protein
MLHENELNNILYKINNSPSDLNYKDLNILVNQFDIMKQKLEQIKKITKSNDNNASTEKYTITTIKELLEDF